MYIVSEEIAYRAEAYDAIGVDEKTLLLFRDGKQTVLCRYESAAATYSAYLTLIRKIAAQDAEVIWL